MQYLLLAVGTVSSLLLITAGIIYPVQLSGKAEQEEVRFEPIDINAGNITEGESAIVQLAIHNTFPHAVKSVFLNTGCSCAAVSDRLEDLPAKSCKIYNIKWNTNGKRGVAKQEIQYAYAMPNGDKYKITTSLSANIIPIIKSSHDKIIMDSSSGFHQTVELSSASAAFRIANVASNHASIVCSIKDTNKIDVRFDPNIEGWQTGNLNLIIYLDTPSSRELILPVKVLYVRR